MSWTDLFQPLNPYMDVIRLMFFIVFAFLLFSLILGLFKRHLLRKVKRKKQISNIVGFFGLLKFIFVFFLVIIVFIAYYGDLGDIGFIAGTL